MIFESKLDLKPISRPKTFGRTLALPLSLHIGGAAVSHIDLAKLICLCVF
jgi:hypothetical protein